MKKALEGLSGIAKVEMDLDRDLFRVTTAEVNGAAPDAILTAIRSLGYEPRLVESAAFRATPEPTHPTGGAPELVQKACERARTERKLVLVDCMGDS